MSPDELTRAVVGQFEEHLAPLPTSTLPDARVHRVVVAPLLDLQRSAAAGGFDLRLASAYRAFDRQRSIWNRKATGQLPVLDSQARPIDITTLSDRDLAFAILRWSALPGASRHHWGTDVDVYDAASTPPGYEVQLIPAEVEGGGMHAALHEWLDARIAADEAYGFYRPYDRDRGGVAPERWHLSYAPLASEFLTVLTPDVLRDTVTRADLALRDVVLAHLDEIHARFVANVAPPPESGL